MSAPVKNDSSTKPSLAPVDGSRDGALLALSDAVREFSAQLSHLCDQLVGVRRELAELRADAAVNAARLQALAGDPTLAARIEQHLHVERLSLDSLKTIVTMKNTVLADMFNGTDEEMSPEMLLKMYEMGLGGSGRGRRPKRPRPQENTPPARGQ